MNAASLGIRGGSESVDDRRLPTWISISAPPTLSRSPIRTTAAYQQHHSPLAVAVTPAERKQNQETSSSKQQTPANKRTQDSLLVSPTLSPQRNIQTNVLVELCQKGLWNEVCMRCQSHPEETVPVPLGPIFTNTAAAANPKLSSPRFLPPMKRERKNSHDFLLSPTSTTSSTCLQSVHSITPLGIACQAEFDTADKMLGVVEKLLEASPEQVQSNDGVAGHTPLRDAIRNHSASPEIVSVLLNADQYLPSQDKAVMRNDRDGLSPMDHLIMGVHAGSPSHSLESLKLVIQKCPEVIGCSTENKSQPFITAASVSPLIRLLSMGTSFGLHITAAEENIPSSSSLDHNKNMSSHQKHHRMGRVLECAKLLISFTNLTTAKTKSTKCTPLHVAVRNYGNVVPLIQLLLESDTQNIMVQECNIYGDLPLHVACSVGVPMQVLKLVLEHTVAALPGAEVHPLIWSVNKSGYTPVDLEWMRHIEGGRGFYEVRSFYPLEASGIRSEGSLQDKFYKALLQEAVDQVMKNDTDSSSNHCCSCRETQAKTVVGALLDRIVLVVQFAHNGRDVVSSSSSCTDFLLHAASALSRVPGPSLPTPLLRLFAWMYPNQVAQRDETGKLPLHHAVMAPQEHTTAQDATSSSSSPETDRTSWIKLLLEQHSHSAMAADNDLRLPLHYALDSRNSYQNNQDFEREWNEVIQLLVNKFPESVDRRDPKTCLVPFMQAAAAQQDTSESGNSLESIYFLLRRHPTLVQGGAQQW